MTLSYPLRGFKVTAKFDFLTLTSRALTLYSLKTDHPEGKEGKDPDLPAIMVSATLGKPEMPTTFIKGIVEKTSVDNDCSALSVG